jgi:hypothetical protein
MGLGQLLPGTPSNSECVRHWGTALDSGRSWFFSSVDVLLGRGRRSGRREPAMDERAYRISFVTVSVRSMVYDTRRGNSSDVARISLGAKQ